MPLTLKNINERLWPQLTRDCKECRPSPLNRHPLDPGDKASGPSRDSADLALPNLSVRSVASCHYIALFVSSFNSTGAVKISYRGNAKGVTLPLWLNCSTADNPPGVECEGITPP